MRTQKYVLFVFIFCLAANIALAIEAYWVSFSESYDGNRKFLMKIDQSGNVLQGPVEVNGLALFAKVNGATAIYKQGTRLFLWTPADYSAGLFPIGRAIIDLNTLNTTSFTITNLATSDIDFLQAAKSANNLPFLAFEKRGTVPPPQEEILAPMREDNGSLFAAEMNSNGKPTSNRWRLSPRTDDGNDQGSVATDGLMALSMDHDSPPDKLYTQPLKNTNRPKGDPKVVTNFENTRVNIDSVDVSNVVNSNQRFVAYQIGRGRDVIAADVIDPEMPAIVLQRISSVTGDKLGTPILINDEFRFDWRQVIAIDPAGSFVLFTIGGDVVPVGSAGQYGTANGCEKIVYQALSSNGQPTGATKELVYGCDIEVFSFMGLDIVRD